MMVGSSELGTIIMSVTIKDIVYIVPLKLEIIRLAEDLIQLKGNLNFSRTAYNLGVGKWSSTSILKDNAQINTNLFLFKN